ncbi:MAG: EexN family lipoprotein, partial [Gammaproteobacteria bacterium]|nr:EexN family lipoprotein [Gammaproteobacteria bacterium]
MGDTATILHLTLALCAFGWLVGCAEDPLPPSVEAFMEDPILLDATMVRCVANRNAINTEPECVNAREAVERLAAAEEKARRAELEAESARKREALRRSREVADEARRLVEEAERRRREAELLGFDPAAGDPADPAYAELEAVDVPGGNAPAALTEEAPQSTPETGTEHLAGGEK